MNMLVLVSFCFLYTYPCIFFLVEKGESIKCNEKICPTYYCNTIVKKNIYICEETI